VFVLLEHLSGGCGVCKCQFSLWKQWQRVLFNVGCSPPRLHRSGFLHSFLISTFLDGFAYFAHPGSILGKSPSVPTRICSVFRSNFNRTVPSPRWRGAGGEGELPGLRLPSSDLIRVHSCSFVVAPHFILLTGPPISGFSLSRFPDFRFSPPLASS
jgi:hypothetical protein